MKKTLPAALAGAVALLTVAVYLPSLRNDFVNWDDYIYVVDNLRIRHLDWGFLRWAATDLSTDYWLPLTWLSHAIDYALWGADPSGHHLTSILLHGINTFLVVLLLARLIDAAGRAPARDGGGQGGASGIPRRSVMIMAGTTGILFGLHPLHVESVAWVSERKDLVCSLFFLLSTMAYIRHAAAPPDEEECRGRIRAPGRWYYFSLLLFCLSLAGKPMAVTLPLVLLLLDWYPLGRIGARRLSAGVFLEKIPFFLLSLLASVIAYAGQAGRKAVISLGAIPLPDRVSAAFTVLAAYLGKMAAPVSLLPFYPSQEKMSFFSFSFFVLCGLTAGALAAARRQKVFAAALAYYCITLIPVLGLVRVGTVLMADRFTYLPSIGPFAAAGVVTAWAWSRADSPGPRRAAFRTGLVIAAGCMLVALCAAAVKQTAVWRDSITLWDYVIRHEPDKVPLAYNNRGLMFRERGRPDLAVVDFTKAIDLNPDYSHPYTNRGIVLTETGRTGPAIVDFDKAISLEPDYADAYRWRGEALKAAGQTGPAIDDLTRAIALQPDDPSYYVSRGLLFQAAGRIDRAIGDFSAAVARNPLYSDAYVYRGLAYKEQGQFENAVSDYTTAIRLSPSSAAAYNDRGVAFKHLNRSEEALADYDRAVALNPSFALAYVNRGIVLGMQRRDDAAIADFSRALSLEPGLAAAYAFRGEAWLRSGRPDLAGKDFRDACSRGSEEGCRARRSMRSR